MQIYLYISKKSSNFAPGFRMVVFTILGGGRSGVLAHLARAQHWQC